MVNYDLLEENLNEEAIRILSLIKEDYYDLMSEQKKRVLDNLLDTNNHK